MIKIIIFIFLILALVGCGGSSSGTSDSASSGATGGAGGGAGTTSGGNGNASYYAMNLAGTIQSAIPLPGGALEVASTMYVDASDGATTQDLEVGVYQPTCLSGASYEDFTMVLMNRGSSTYDTTLSLRVTSTGVTTGVDAYDETNKYKTRYGTNVSVTGTCTTGKMTLSNGDVVYSNSKVAIYRKGTALYVGLASSTTQATTTATSSITYGTGDTAYYLNYGGVDYFDSTNTLNTATATQMPIALLEGNVNKFLMTNNSAFSTGTKSIFIVGSSAAKIFMGTHGVFGSKHVVIGSSFVVGGGTTIAAQNAGLGDQSAGTNYTTLKGATAVYIAIEQ